MIAFIYGMIVGFVLGMVGVKGFTLKWWIAVFVLNTLIHTYGLWN